MKFKLHELDSKTKIPKYFGYEEIVLNYKLEFKKKPVKNFKTIRKDFHKHSLFEVKYWLFNVLPDYTKVGIKKFSIIHGFNHGTVIRNYLRDEFIEEFNKENPNLKIRIINVEEGRTILIIKRRK